MLKGKNKPKSIVIMEMSIHRTMTKQFIDTNMYCILYNAILYYMKTISVNIHLNCFLKSVWEMCFSFQVLFSTFFLLFIYFVYQVLKCLNLERIYCSLLFSFYICAIVGELVWGKGQRFLISVVIYLSLDLWGDDEEFF